MYRNSLRSIPMLSLQQKICSTKHSVKLLCSYFCQCRENWEINIKLGLSTEVVVWLRNVDTNVEQIEIACFVFLPKFLPLQVEYPSKDKRLYKEVRGEGKKVGI